MKTLAPLLPLLACATVLQTVVAQDLPQQEQQPDEVVDVTTTPYYFQGELETIEWFGNDAKTVVLLTTDKEAHLSTDEGKSFKSLTSQLGRLSRADAKRITKITTSKANKDMIVLETEGHQMFISTNKGKSWTITSPLPRIGEVLLHPADDRLILASSLNEVCFKEGSDGSDSEELCFKRLFLSSDRGRKWKLIEKYVVQFDWLCSMKTASCKVQKDVIIATLYRPSYRTRSQLFGFWHPEIDCVETSNFFRTRRVLVPGGNRFVFSEDFLLVAQVKNQVVVDEVEISLQISRDHGVTFVPGRLPFKLSQNSYTILDTSEGSIFLNVNHGGVGGKFGHVYASDSRGTGFSLSIRDNHRDKEGKADFEKVRSLEGVYIANYVENAVDIRNSLKRQVDTRLDQDSSHGGTKPKLKSIITFDKGGEWSSLQPPQVDSLGEASECKGCSLHLHGRTSLSGRVYSVDTAVGIVMSTGNIGPYLDSSETNTFLSRDGGVTWKEVRKGSYIYEIGDHGGLIVMASDEKKTKDLLFSWNEGHDWNQIEFSDKLMAVDNIIIEPTSTSRTFIVYGKAVGISNMGSIVSVDFSRLHQRECKKLAPTDPNSDYELWSPMAGLSQTTEEQRCLLGHVTEYTRRKELSACYNPLKHESQRTKTNCACTITDYECDFGYVRKFNQGPCERDPEVRLSSMLTNGSCPSNGIYTVSNGYRLIAGDTCVGGVQLGPTAYTCRNGILGVSLHGWAVLCLILALVIGMGIITYKSSKNPDEEFEKFSTRHFGNDPDQGTKTLTGYIKYTLLFIGGTVLGAFGKGKGNNNNNEYSIVREGEYGAPDSLGIDEDYWEEDDLEEVHELSKTIEDGSGGTGMKETQDSYQVKPLPQVPKVSNPPVEDFVEDFFADSGEV